MFMLSVAILMLSVILRPEGPMSGAKASVELCLGTLIPSLFPLFVLNRMLVSSGAAVRFFARFGKPFAKLFRLPPAAAAAVVLGLLSGYPTGAKIAEELYEKEIITNSELRLLTSFCNNAGPIFITGSVGAGMLGNSKAGIFLLIVHIVSAMLVGLIFSLGAEKSVGKTYCPIQQNRSAAELFTNSVTSSCADISVICGYVIFFGMLMSYANQKTAAGKAVCMLFEMTNACRILAASGGKLCLPLISATLGWGGLCVHAQSFSVIRHKKTYLAGKLLQGMISFIISAILLLFVHF